MRPATLAVLCSALLAATAAPREGRACIHEVFRVVDPRIEALHRAERALRANRPAAAAREILSAFPNVRRAGAIDAGRTARARRVMAVAVARLNGAVGGGHGFRAATEAQRAANLAWAATTLRELWLTRPRDAGLVTDLAEALSRRPVDHAEALRMLETLAQRDVLTTAHGWAALARLRAATGWAEGRDSAVARCRAMARPGVVCDAGAGVVVASLGR